MPKRKIVSRGKGLPSKRNKQEKKVSSHSVGRKSQKRKKGYSNEEDEDENQDVTPKQRNLATNYAVYLAKRDEIGRKKCVREHQRRGWKKRKSSI